MCVDGGWALLGRRTSIKQLIKPLEDSSRTAARKSRDSKQRPLVSVKTKGYDGFRSLAKALWKVCEESFH